jgi:hypothetical protein
MGILETLASEMLWLGYNTIFLYIASLTMRLASNLFFVHLVPQVQYSK